MAAHKKPSRKPLSKKAQVIATRDGYVDALLRELDKKTGDTARSALLKMIGQVHQHFDAPPPVVEERVDLTPAQALAVLEEALPDWSDELILAVHDEGIRRGIPGFVPRPLRALG